MGIHISNHYTTINGYTIEVNIYFLLETFGLNISAGTYVSWLDFRAQSNFIV